MIFHHKILKHYAALKPKENAICVKDGEANWKNKNQTMYITHFKGIKAELYNFPLFLLNTYSKIINT